MLGNFHISKTHVDHFPCLNFSSNFPISKCWKTYGSPDLELRRYKMHDRNPLELCVNIALLGFEPTKMFTAECCRSRCTLLFFPKKKSNVGKACKFELSNNMLDKGPITKPTEVSHGFLCIQVGRVIRPSSHILRFSQTSCRNALKQRSQ